MRSRAAQSKTTQALRQVSTLPHRESDGFFLLFLKMQPMRWSRLHLAENSVSSPVRGKNMIFPEQDFLRTLFQAISFYHIIQKINLVDLFLFLFTKAAAMLTAQHIFFCPFPSLQYDEHAKTSSISHTENRTIQRFPMTHLLPTPNLLRENIVKT